MWLESPERMKNASMLQQVIVVKTSNKNQGLAVYLKTEEHVKIMKII